MEQAGGAETPPVVPMSVEEARRLNEAYSRQRVEYAESIGRPITTTGRGHG